MKKYKQLNWSSLFEADKEVVKTGDYAMPLSIEWDYKTFITKYSKIAYPVERNNRLRKVIWKEIYIVDWTNEIKLPDDLSLNAPFTLIATSWANIRITKNIYVNMMLITDWKIIFDAKNACNPEKDAAGTVLYGHAWQLINGIFYAWSWFESDNEIYNIWDSTQNKPLNNIWCDYGNLHIKWAVIGKLNEVVANRRSELYTWFNAWWTEKRNTVLNWASVVLEYNPTLFWNMPPWAEEFNKLLRTERE